METSTKVKPIKPIIKLLAALLCGSFFLPLVTVFERYDGDTIRSATYTGLQFVFGLNFVFYGMYPIVLGLLILPAVLFICCFTKLKYKHLLKIAMAGLIGMAWFNAHFVFGLEYRNAADATLLYWVAIVVYSLLILLIAYGIKANGEIKPPQNVSPPYSDLQKMIISGIFLGVAFMVSLLTTIPIYIGGVPLVRIGFSGIFHNTIAILFGPLFGGIQRAMADILNFFLNPRITGAFLLPVTMVAFFRGLSVGYLWIKVKNINPKVFSIAYSIAFGGLMAWGLFNVAVLFITPHSTYALWLSPNNTVRVITSYGMIAIGAFGLIPQAIVYKVTRKTGNDKFYTRFIKLLVAIMLPGVFFNFVNTYIILMMSVGPVTRQLGFVYFWIPRFANEVAISLVMTYLNVVLFEVYERAIGRRLT